MREAERERREAENAKREAEAKLERERREADAKLEREKLELMERIEAQKREIEKEAMRLLEKHVRPKPLSERPKQNSSVISVKLKSFLSVKN